MFRPRVIPVLLLKNLALVKSKKFTDHNYIGDAINAVRIFNDLKADELVFLDIEATAQNRTISLDFIKDVGEEANMPFSVGGGIRTIEDIRRIIKTGAERVIIGSYAVIDPDFIFKASQEFGSSTITVCIDVKKKLLGGYQVCYQNGKKGSGLNPEEFALCMQEKGAGEVIIQSIDRDGMMQGYDIDLTKRISNSITIPLVALGGAGTLEHLKQGNNPGGATGLAAGSLFVYHGPKKGVLISYPDRSELSFES
jgi:cyclase